MSKRQYLLLQAFIDNPMSIKEAHKINQITFRSFLIRNWIAYTQGRGFHITTEGRNAWYNFHEASIFRKDPTRPLTAYFDQKVYKLHVVRKAS